MTLPKDHPAHMRRVTPESVSEVLSAAGVTHGRVFAFRPGVVRVEVGAVLPGRRRYRQRAVVVALESQRQDEYWGVEPVDITYRWRWWVSWVSVRDPGLDWTDPDTGLDYISTLAAERTAE